MFLNSNSTNKIDTYLLQDNPLYLFKFDAEKGTILKKIYLRGVFDGLPNCN